MSRRLRSGHLLGGGRRVAASGAILGAAVLLSGCFATTKHVQMVESDVTRQGAWTDERIQNLESELEAVRAENETLRLRVDDLTDQISGLGGEVSTRLAELNASDERTIEEIRRATRTAADDSKAAEDRRAQDRLEMLDRMNVILDEVVRENSRLAERITEMEESAFTFGRMHKVRQGESISSIATQYGLSPEEIVTANDLPDASLIQVGQELLIPGVSP